MSKIIRRVEEGICAPEEFDRACAWVRSHCEEGADNLLNSGAVCR